MYFHNIYHNRNQAQNALQKVQSNGILYKYNLEILITTLNVILHNLIKPEQRIDHQTTSL